MRVRKGIRMSSRGPSMSIISGRLPCSMIAWDFVCDELSGRNPASITGKAITGSCLPVHGAGTWTPMSCPPIESHRGCHNRASATSSALRLMPLGAEPLRFTAGGSVDGIKDAFPSSTQPLPTATGRVRVSRLEGLQTPSSRVLPPIVRSRSTDVRLVLKTDVGGFGRARVGRRRSCNEWNAPTLGGIVGLSAHLLRVWACGWNDDKVSAFRLVSNIWPSSINHQSCIHVVR